MAAEDGETPPSEPAATQPIGSEPPSEEERLSQLGELLNCIQLDELLNMAITWVPRVTETRLVSIFVLDDETNQLVMMRHNHRSDLDVRIDLDDPGTLILEVFRKRKAILIHDIPTYVEENELPITLNKRGKYGSSACMLVPIFFRPPDGGEKEIIGALNLADKEDFSPFSKEDLRFAARIGETLGTAIHNTRIIEVKLGGHQTELMAELQGVRTQVEATAGDAGFVDMQTELEEAARKVQMMLPELPDLGEYELAVHYSPMEGVGGDFYDFIEIDEHRLGIVIGDVAGHGMGAAMVMSMTKQALKLFSRIHGKTTEALIRANAEIHGALKGELFVSIFFAILDRRTHVLSYARAGHNPPFLHNPSRDPATRTLDGKGMVVGSTGSKRFGDVLEEVSIPLEPGDLILLYTDGLVEAMNEESEEFGEDRLVLSLEANVDCEAQLIVDRLARNVTGFSRAQDDDRTMLVLRVGDIVRTAVAAPVAEDELLMVDEWLHEGDVAALAAEEVYFQAEPVAPAGPSLTEADQAALEALVERLRRGSPWDDWLADLDRQLAQLTRYRDHLTARAADSAPAPGLDPEEIDRLREILTARAEIGRLEEPLRALIDAGDFASACDQLYARLPTAKGEGHAELTTLGRQLVLLARACPSSLV